MTRTGPCSCRWLGSLINFVSFLSRWFFSWRLNEVYRMRFPDSRNFENSSRPGSIVFVQKMMEITCWSSPALPHNFRPYSNKMTIVNAPRCPSTNWRLSEYQLKRRVRQVWRTSPISAWSIFGLPVDQLSSLHRVVACYHTWARRAGCRLFGQGLITRALQPFLIPSYCRVIFYTEEGVTVCVGSSC